MSKHCSLVSTILAGLLLGWAALVEGFDRREGARPQGMGDAFMALADDMNALNYNPAGLGLIKNPEGSLEYANLYPGLDEGLLQENHLVYAQPISEMGGLGASWNNRSLAGIYHENEFILGYAHNLAPQTFWAGAAAKMFYLDYTDEPSLQSNDYFRDGASKLQVALDLGFLYALPKSGENDPAFRFGFSVINLNEPDLGVKTSAREPISLNLGSAVVYGEWDGALDLVYRDSQSEVHAGAEKWWMDGTWGARIGAIAGSDTSFTLTAGGSFCFPLDNTAKMRINYAFQYPMGGIQDTYGIHRLSLDIIGGSAAGAASLPNPQPTEKFVRIRSYLLERIDVYLETLDRIQQLKTSPNPDLLAKINQAEQQLHEGLGKLILEQDILGFLKKLKEALQTLPPAEIIESGNQNPASPGQEHVDGSVP